MLFARPSLPSKESENSEGVKAMNRRKIFSIVFCFVLACGVLLPAARADEWNQKMKLTFNESIQVPGATLPAGTYWFVLADTQSDRHIVQIFDQDGSTLRTTVFAIPTLREQSHGRVEVVLAERPHHEAEALYKLYYPGSMTGQEFLYPHREDRQLRHDSKLDLLIRPNGTPSAAVLAGE
jgi:hypothetical protein